MNPSVPPPPATRRDDLVDAIHGHRVADPFRWLEADDDPEVRGWVAGHNARTRQVLDALPRRADLHDRLSSLLRAGSSVACSVEGDRVFSLERWGHHDQTVLVVRSALRPGVARSLIDPMALTGDPTAAIDWYHASPGGRLVAYGLSTNGDERSTLHVVDVESGHMLTDTITDTRGASVAWSPDCSAFAYSRYPHEGEVPDDERDYWRKVFWHQLGTDPARDPVVWDDLPDKTAWPNVSLSADGRWLLVHVSTGWSRVDVHLIDRRTGAHTVMIEGIEAVSSFEIVGDEAIGITTLEADRGRVVSAPLSAGWHDNWCTIVPESDAVLEALVATSDSLVVLSSRSAVSRLDRYDHDGTARKPIDLGEQGSLAGLSGSHERDEAFFSLTSFARPPTLFRWRPGEVRDWSRLGESDGHGDGPQGTYVVEQVRYPSTDGTEIPMFLIRAADTVPGPDTPCVLTGYGGFSVSMGPAYSAAVVAVCDDGGLYAVANLRGGSEEGEAWHRAGMRERKQQVFDDFAAAADWLVDRGLTSRHRLAIRGGSNGGLLMGAAITQRPDLCRAAQIAVPLLDMVRYPLFLIAQLWIPEYGDPERADEFEWLYAYSPYHRVVDGTCYPAVLLTTAEDDSRVAPLHARKMTARLAEATSCGDTRPVLLREEAQAGHGQGKPVTSQVDELADVLAFLWWQLDQPPGR
ncbi:MAG: prolyl oligopeptidase family serine peptidase [Acidimicrobiales bacterium]